LTYSSFIRSTAVGIASAAILAQAAFASGEPKNQWPFTRPVGGRAVESVVASTTARADAATRARRLRGEAMNRRYGLGSGDIQGEPKNEAPFTRPSTVVISSGRGFDWTSGGIGAAGGIGTALAGAGVLLVARRSPRTA
jgi:hypothetical protein